MAITKLPLKKPADIAPTGLVINGVKASYDVNSTLSIDLYLEDWLIDLEYQWIQLISIDFKLQS